MGRFNRGLILILIGAVAGFTSCQQKTTEVPSSVDTTPPQILKRTQNDSQNGNRISEDIEVYFSEPLNPETISAATVRIVDENNLPLESVFSYEKSSNKITITPKFNAPKLAKIILGDGITDLSGNNLLFASFTIRYPEWVYVKTQSLESPDNLSGGSLVFDSLNHPNLMYFTQQSRKLIVTSFFNDKWNQLGEPLTIDSQYNFQISNLQLHSVGEDIFASWRQANRINGQTIYRIAKYENSKWSEFTQITGLIGVSDIASVIDSKGRIYVTYYDSNRLIWVKYLDLGVWKLSSTDAVNKNMPVISPGTPAFYSASELTMQLRNDLPVLAWADGYPRLIQVKIWDGVNWTSAGSTPSNSSSGSSFPSLASKNGRLVLAWIEKNPISSKFNIYAKEWVNSSWVSLGEKLNDTGDGGDPLVFFAPNDDSPQIIYWKAENGQLNIVIKKYTNSWDNLFLGSPYGNGSFNNLNRNQPFTDRKGLKFILGVDFGYIYVSYPNIKL